MKANKYRLWGVQHISVRIVSLILIIGLMFSLSGCGSAGGDTGGQENGDRTELTEEEMKNGHASFQMEENLVVDADVTTKEKYEKGLASYYLKIFYDTDEEHEKEFRKHPVVSGHSLKEWGELLNQIQPGKFKGQKLELLENPIAGVQDYIGDNDRQYSFTASWAGVEKGLDKKTDFNSLVVLMELEGGTLSNLALCVRSYLMDYQDSKQLSFLGKPEERAEQVKRVLEELSGRTVNDRYEIIAGTKENVKRLNEMEPWMEIAEPEEDMAFFAYDYDVDGLPFKDKGLNYKMGSHETAADLCYWGSAGNSELIGISEGETVVGVDKNGMVSLEYYNMRDVGDVYKERTPVVSPNEVLKQVKANYEKTLLTDKCVISDIELVYTGYFSDGSEGEIQPIVAPFWVVTVYEDVKSSGRVQFVYDAYTGKFMRRAA